mmetsp:Transcript_37969/g.74350  ORF Transcript_37969/g.74350 Transcript_37969/m.74350 type:complete len:1241 (+) Transcript_37969:64-3786(+)
MEPSSSRLMESSTAHANGNFPHTSIYIPDTKYGWIPAEIVEKHFKSKKDKSVVAVTVKTLKQEGWDESTEFNEGQAYNFEENSSIRVDLTLPANKELLAQNIDTSGDAIHEGDMTNLTFVHEAAILFNLKQRNFISKPYCRINDILVAVNPLQSIHGMYSTKKLRKYAREIIWDSEYNARYSKRRYSKRPSELNTDVSTSMKGLTESFEPHIYETSCIAYKGLVSSGLDQTILVSGESGSGKTETVKILMNNFAKFSNLAESSKISNPHDSVISKILQSNFIMEAFGNAQTIRNANSSRFSKFCTLQFDISDENSTKKSMAPPLIGSNCQTYVLEKMRAVHQINGERNFHIFYQLLAADNAFKISIWEGLKDTDCNSFAYIGFCDVNEINGKTDSDHLKDTIEALTTIGINSDKRTTLFRAVCIVLQLGNLSLNKGQDDTEMIIVDSKEELAKLAQIMGVPEKDIEETLTCRSVKIGKEKFKVPLSITDASNSRDALARGIYSYIFDFIVDTLNDATEFKTDSKSALDVTDTRKAVGSVNLLDIFGFEAYETCQFEQLCINYANEKIQVKYTNDNFKTVLDEFKADGVDIGDLYKVHKPEVLFLLEGKVGLINILNEECIRPGATAASFVFRLKQINVNSPCLIRSKLARQSEFGIKHFAADCTYSATDFLTRNKDTINDDLVKCVLKCTNVIVSTQCKKLQAGGKGLKMFAGQQRGWLVGSTVLGKFQRQLKILMNIVEGTSTRYVRCIKPNNSMQPRITNQKMLLEQLKCAGLVQALSVSRLFFQKNLDFGSSLSRFRCLIIDKLGQMPPRLNDDDRDYVKNIFAKLLSGYVVTDSTTDDERSSFACGHKKIYFREGSLDYLEVERGKLRTSASIKIQYFYWTFLSRIRYLSLRKAIIFIQASSRRRQMMHLYKKKIQSSIKIQMMFRLFRARKCLHDLKMNNAAIKIQRWHRCKDDFRKFVCMLQAAKKIQRFLQKRMAKDTFISMMALVVEDARKDVKLKKLINNIETVLDDSNTSNDISFKNMELLRESQQELCYAREEMYRLRGNVSNMKAERKSSSEEFERLQQRHEAVKAAAASMKMSVTESNDTNDILVKNLSRQRGIITSKIRDLKVKSLQAKKALEEVQNEKITIEEAHRKEINALTTKMNLMEISFENKLSVDKMRHEVKEVSLQRKHDKLQKEVEEEEVSYAISFGVMMNAMNQGKSGKPDLRDQTPSFKSTTSFRSDFDEEMLGEV